MPVLTKTAADVFAPTDVDGVPRGADMGEASTWGTEMEARDNAAPASDQRGGVLQQAAQADSTASDVAGLKADFNALLAKARAAGWLAT